jgi:hypothetical protein
VIQPAELHFSPLHFRLMSLINPFILLSLLVPLGCVLAPKVRLEAPLLRAWLGSADDPRSVFRRQLGPAGWVGLGCGLLLVGYGILSAPWFAQAPAAARFELPLLPRLLYGGVTEELLARWGLMSLFVWLAFKLPLGCGSAPYIAGAIMAALLFAAGHLPVLHLLVGKPSAAMLFAVLLGNMVPGLLFGLLYWKRGLESAMFAHALTHLVAWTAELLV